MTKYYRMKQTPLFVPLSEEEKHVIEQKKRHGIDVADPRKDNKIMNYVREEISEKEAIELSDQLYDEKVALEKKPSSGMKRADIAVDTVKVSNLNTTLEQLSLTLFAETSERWQDLANTLPFHFREVGRGYFPGGSEGIEVETNRARLQQKREAILEARGLLRSFQRQRLSDVKAFIKDSEEAFAKIDISVTDKEICSRGEVKMMHEERKGSGKEIVAPLLETYRAIQDGEIGQLDHRINQMKK